MIPGSTLRAVAIAALVTAPTVIMTACYGPTEVVVVITTDVPCDTKPTTAIYKGLPFSTAASATTYECSAVAGSDAKVGSLVFFPSGDRDGNASVKVVLTRGQGVDECGAHPERCIVATRTFSFVSHLSRRLPIRLLQDCLGKVCADGQTCGEGGACVSDAVVCSGDDCKLVGEVDGSDAGPAPGDSGPVDDGPAPPSCLGPGGGNVLTKVGLGMPGPLQAATANGVFYFLDRVSKASPTVASVTMAGGPPTPLANIPGLSASLIALTASGPNWAALSDYVVGPTTGAVVTSSAGSAQLTGADANPFRALVIKTGSGGIRGFIARAQSVESASLESDGGVTTAPFAKTGGDRIAVDGTSVYVGSSTSVSAFDLTTLQLQQAFELASPGVADDRPPVFANRGDTVFAAGYFVGKSDPKIVMLKGGQPFDELITAKGSVVSLAADNNHVYWTDGATIWRANAVVANPQAPEPVFTASGGESVDHLSINGQCLTFWSQSLSDGAGALRIFPKGGK